MNKQPLEESKVELISLIMLLESVYMSNEKPNHDDVLPFLIENYTLEESVVASYLKTEPSDLFNQVVVIEEVAGDYKLIDLENAYEKMVINIEKMKELGILKTDNAKYSVFDEEGLEDLYECSHPGGSSSF